MEATMDAKSSKDATWKPAPEAMDSSRILTLERVSGRTRVTVLISSRGSPPPLRILFSSPVDRQISLAEEAREVKDLTIGKQLKA